MRLRLTIEYAGTRYSGWQIQKNAKTVQGEIERAITAATGERDFELYGSGRTDAGVHALAQVAHLDVHTTMPPETLRRRINDELPADINILLIERSVTSSTRGTMRSAARTSIKSHDAGRPLPSRMCGGSRTISMSPACARPRRDSPASMTSARSPMPTLSTDRPTCCSKASRCARKATSSCSESTARTSSGNS